MRPTRNILALAAGYPACSSDTEMLDRKRAISFLSVIIGPEKSGPFYAPQFRTMRNPDKWPAPSTKSAHPLRISESLQRGAL
jgi:hypothetical protein